MHFTVPGDVAELMPVMPGDDCLAGSGCRCHIDVEYDGNTAYVYWLLDPLAESCPVCVAHAVESPFVFNLDEELG